jgi:predicted small secreted protein
MVLLRTDGCFVTVQYNNPSKPSSWRRTSCHSENFAGRPRGHPPPHPLQFFADQFAKDHKAMKHKSIIPTILLGLSFLLLGGSLSACNTVKGAGQDIKSAGKAIENKAEEKKSY